MASLLHKIFGSANDRTLKRLVPLVERINRLESELVGLSDEALRSRTGVFRERAAKGEPLDDLLPEAFATVREASKRTLGQRHFDVQLIGGMVLHEGNIAEMKTGEGKTLVATLPAYLNALAGRGVHVVTVNDYLARRDAQWMGEIHRFLGLEVGVIVHDLTDAQRRAAYGADITYGTNNELGFDYLRDNMKGSLAQCVQRDLFFAIVDEVDSILIDEARTPLIISGPSEESTQLYSVANRVIPRLAAGTKGEPSKGVEETGDYWVDEKHHSATLTEQGVHAVEKTLGIENLYEPQMLPVLHAVHQALIAHTLKKIDVDYVVKPGEGGRPEVVIVDEFTGRLMPGRRWSDGLHQAVEAKENIPIQSENQTLATVTFQNFFRMYEKLGGMTGTADTEAAEFAKIYDLDVVVIPTNRPMIRKDLADVVYKSQREKFDAVVEEIRERHATGQPLLVGTISIETSEMLSRKLQKFGVKHNVLNAKQHEREAEIVAQAGRKGAVTIATNMAGRGTDIVLGGNPEFLALAKCQHDKLHPDYAITLARFEAECAAERAEVVSAGGLHIVGTERHESRRIDNQLRGRSGRQGDAGSSRFFLSLEDELMRIFGGERLQGWMERLGLQEGEAIEHRMVTRAIENAQKKVEARNFDMRKHVLDYDDVMNKQRQAFYGRRRELLSREQVHDEIVEMVEDVLVTMLGRAFPEKGGPDDEALATLAIELEQQFGVVVDRTKPPFVENGAPLRDRDALGHSLLAALTAHLDEKERHWDEVASKYRSMGYPLFRELEKGVLLDTLDRQWKDHLLSMDGLREGINLRGYAQKDPKVEYQREGFQLFEEMIERIDGHAVERIFKVAIREPQLAPSPQPAAPATGPAAEAAAPAAGPVVAGTAIAAPAAGAAGAPPAARPVTMAPIFKPAFGDAANAAGRSPGRPASAAKTPGRNDPCTCGSGKKYKKCCGAG
ncbi:MAG: preprotein translocase subunit SecA [Deltaproteobacteria bacterium]|nr:preprotein translocase subunit SecA [Deltaproteobacteria bacterium]